MEPIKILVVDDEPLVERLINQRFRKKIKSKHYEFHFAENGVEGLSKLDQHQDVDIILSDINMPKMDGLTFLSKLGELERELKVVLVSAYGDMKNIRSGMNLGAYDFVTKPIDFQDLEITIEKALREVQVLKEAQQVRLKLTHLEQELSVATKIQQSIIPSDYEEVLTSKKIDLFAKMIPAKEVGGDFYDFFKVDEDHVACIVADVSGKGIPAALFMAISRTLIKATSLGISAPAECLNKINPLLCRDNEANMFVTVFYAVINIHTGEMTYSSAGHNPPYIINPDGSIQTLVDGHNIPLGIIDTFKYKSKTKILERSAALVLFTDGITEAIDEDKNFFAEPRLEASLKIHAFENPKEITTSIIEEVKDFEGKMPQTDDITMMVIRRK